MTRPLCSCRERPVGINCYIEERVYYRKLCDQCLRKGRRLKPQAPSWARSGYTKKEKCERCNFKFKLLGQSRVFYVDGNLNNNDWTNLRTVCLNCQEEVAKSKLSWRPSPLVPDF
jgi:hypothetical protein